jgi:fumarylacetoacetase
MTKSWLSISANSPFSLANIPFGIISTANEPGPRPAIAIGDYALDLSAFSGAGGFSKLSTIQPHLAVFSQTTLNDFASLGQPVHRDVRKYIQSILEDKTLYPDILKTNKHLQHTALIPLSAVQTHLPFRIGDYTDFYAGLNHAFNVGVLFRGVDNALQPNYKHLPVGYHGRASSVVPSGTPIRRPQGQILANPTTNPNVPTFSLTKKLDIELELAAFVCKSSKLGEPIPITHAEEHIFGLVLMNDWSARDIQAWEYVPLGPFGSKNFGTTISPWVVTMEALAPFRTDKLNADEEDTPLEYLREPQRDAAYDIKLEVELKTADPDIKTVICKTNAKNLLYSFPQMLAHHSVTGCNMVTGDLLGSGTISGTEAGSLGSLLEQTKNGKEPVVMADGSTRLFLEDGDEVTIRGICGKEGGYVGFGDCSGLILPALMQK